MKRDEYQKQVYDIRELLFNLKDDIERACTKYDDLLDAVNQSIEILSEFE